MRAIRLTLLLLSLLGLGGCLTEPAFDNSPRGNFEALWRIIDEHYCFFQEKGEDYGLDWDETYRYFSQRVKPGMSDEQLFELCGTMLRDLRDGHVNLTSAFNTARFWDWYEHFPANFNDSLQRPYLGTDYRIACGIRYTILPDNIGYIYCPTFENAFGDGNLSAIFRYLAMCNGLIVDVRNNTGGMLTAAQDLAECFTNERLTAGYIKHKTGKGHNDFSSPEPLVLTPSSGIRWQKQTVVLTNRRTYSAANTFVMFMRACPNVVQLGATTGGGGGMPFSSELPNGWGVRFSACPIYDTQMNCSEFGIEPTIRVEQTPTDFAKGRDTLIEAARAWLQQNQAQAKPSGAQAPIR